MPGVRHDLTRVAPNQAGPVRKPENPYAMAKKFPVNPPHPERNCWGCDTYCPADLLVCGNGSERTHHPAELFGEDWVRLGLDPFGEAEGEPEGADA